MRRAISCTRNIVCLVSRLGASIQIMDREDARLRARKRGTNRSVEARLSTRTYVSNIVSWNDLSGNLSNDGLYGTQEYLLQRMLSSRFSRF
jgi:hypothetical protein